MRSLKTKINDKKILQSLFNIQKSDLNKSFRNLTECGFKYRRMKSVNFKMSAMYSFPGGITKSLFNK